MLSRPFWATAIAVCRSLIPGLCLAAFILGANCANAQKIHAIMVGDTLDGSIGVGITENLKNMNGFLHVVQSLTRLDASETQITGVDFNCKSILNVLNNVSASENDTVLFYYTGHGFRRDNTESKFPEFDCRRSLDPDQLSLAAVVTKLQEKRPRLILAFADTCNRLIPQPPVQVVARAFVPLDVQAAAYRHLLIDYSGALMMSGSVPGEYSWYMNTGRHLGGFFTNQLLQVINERSADGDLVRWEDIATDSTKPIFIPMPEPTTQVPQYAALNLSSLAQGKTRQ
jgi:hypothetical protein